MVNTLQPLLIVREAGKSVIVLHVDWCQYELISLLQLCGLMLKSLHASTHMIIELTEQLFHMKIVFPSLFGNKPLDLKTNF